MSDPGNRPALLAVAGRAFLSRDVPNIARSLLSETDDVVAHARRHGMLYFVHRAAQLAAATVPPELDARMRQQATGALAASAELTVVIAALGRAGIGAVALKGPALAAWLYGNLAAREFKDLDIAVAREDRDAAWRVLEGAGYRLPHDMPREVASVVYETIGSWPLEHPAGRRLDLHWRIGYPRFAAPLSGAELVRDRVPIALGGDTVAFTSPAHAAIIALAHAAKHVWTHLEALLAIAALAQRTDVDWDAVGARLRRVRAWTGAVVGFRLAEEQFLVAPPFALAATTGREQLLLATARDLLAADRGDAYARWTERRAHRDSLDTAAARLRYDVARLLAPTPAEWAWCRLPAPLARLYYVLRPARLVMSRGGRDAA